MNLQENYCVTNTSIGEPFFLFKTKWDRCGWRGDPEMDLSTRVRHNLVPTVQENIELIVIKLPNFPTVVTHNIIAP